VSGTALEADCWQATAEALSALLGRYGLSTDELRRICDEAIRTGQQRALSGKRKDSAEIELAMMREITMELNLALVAQGADPEMLIGVARSAYAACWNLRSTDDIMQFIRDPRLG